MAKRELSERSLSPRTSLAALPPECLGGWADSGWRQDDKVRNV